jgi:hypothetical protein
VLGHRALLGELCDVVAVVGHRVDADDRQHDRAGDADLPCRVAEIAGDDREELGGLVLLQGWALGHIDQRIGTGEALGEPVGRGEIDALVPGELDDIVTSRGGRLDDVASNESCRAGDGNAHDVS